MQSPKPLPRISSAGEAARLYAAKRGRDLFPPASVCPTCRDMGIAGYSLRTGEIFCDCPKGKQEQARQERWYREMKAEQQANLQASITKRLRAFSQLHFINGEVPTLGALYPMIAAQKASAFAASWDGMRSLLLMGVVGVGKTQVLLALVHDLMPSLLTHEQGIRLVTAPDLLKELRSGYDAEHQQMREGYAEVLDAYRTCGLLVLDDLGAEKLTGWVMEQFYLLFDYRYRQNLPIFATSNQEFDDLEERLDGRIADRMRQSFDMLKVEGAKHREQMAEARTKAKLQDLRTMDYDEYLKTPHWQETRLAALEHAAHHCSVCHKSNGVLDVHHNTYARRGEELPTDLTVLCRSCHELWSREGKLARHGEKGGR